MSSYDTLSDIETLRDKGWTWTQIGAHYRTSERGVRRWVEEESAPSLPPPVEVNYRKAIVFSDHQYPYFDQPLWELSCQLAADFQPDTVIWAGDNLDFPQLGSFNHDRYRLHSAEEDVEGFHLQVREPLVKAIDRPFREIYTLGNHEWRYDRYLNKNDQPAGQGAFKPIREFLRIPEDAEIYDYGKASGVMLTPRLLVAHGWYARKHSAYTARAHAQDVGDISVITGHTHRVGVHYHSTLSGVQASWEAGHQCDPNTTPKAQEGYQNWQSSAGTLVHYKEDGEAFDVKLNVVFGDNNDRVISGGTEYRIDR